MLKHVHAFMDSMGLETRDGRAFIERAKGLLGKPATQNEARPGGGTLAVWRDPCGAGLAMYVRAEGTFESILPFFSGGRRHKALLNGLLENRQDPVCDAVVMQVLDAKGKPRFEIVAVAHDLEANRERVEPGHPRAVTLSLFLQHPKVREMEVGDTETWLEPIDDEEGPLAPPSSRAKLRALVTRVEERVNRASGAAFQRAKVKVKGVELDVVAPEPGRLEESRLVEGRVVEAECLVVAALDPAKHDATLPAGRR